MSARRVVVTGIGLASPIGNSLPEVSRSLREGVHGVRYQQDWDRIDQLGTRLGAPAAELDLKRWPRKKIRSMGRVALLATHATEMAVADAGLADEDLQAETVGLAYGSTHGSSGAMESFCRRLFETNSLAGLSSNSYLMFMSHTCAANLAQFYGIRGRIVTTCSACASSSQAIGYGYEAVRNGTAEIMVCGGAEELHFVHAGVFDILYAASAKYNDTPDLSPRPFDVARDGLVVGEGAGTFILEPLERAQARGARIHAEVIGYGTNCDGTHVTSPSIEGMGGAMRLALKDAKIASSGLDYINAHGTATSVGDVCESLATHRVIGADVPISSTKAFTGHTLGACGAIESAFCIAMMQDGFVAPSRNLFELDPECAPLAYIRGDAREAKVRTAMCNNFAFGGINTSLIYRRV